MAQLYVDIPQPITLINLINGQRFREHRSEKPEDDIEIPPIDMCSFLMRYVVHETRLIPATTPNAQPTMEPKIGKGYEGSLRVADLHDAFKDILPGTLVGVSESDWKVVDAILKEIVWQNQMIAGQLAPFMRAWRNASGHDEKWKREREKNGEAKQLPDHVLPATT